MTTLSWPAERFDSMDKMNFSRKCAEYLDFFCGKISDRSVGAPGNHAATDYFEKIIDPFVERVEIDEFDALDWRGSRAELVVGEERFETSSSPYSLGCYVRGELALAETLADLERGDYEDKILLIRDELAREQLMPKSFVFYNPEEHQKIVNLLETSGAVALVCATERNPSLAGGVYPFPLIEDGDFDVPSVFTTDVEGEIIAKRIGDEAVLKSDCERIPSKARNVTGFVGPESGERIVVTAHIDAKKGTPGAIDNATGVSILLMIAEALKDYSGERRVEIVAFNGEDYYSVPGQMNWIFKNDGKFRDILLNVNIDGAGYKKGESAISFYDLPDKIRKIAENVIREFPGVVEGPKWVQGDHGIFTNYGRPAIAASSLWFTENVDSREITHTPKDNLDIVDCDKVAELATALAEIIRKI